MRVWVCMCMCVCVLCFLFARRMRATGSPVARDDTNRSNAKKGWCVLCVFCLWSSFVLFFFFYSVSGFFSVFCSDILRVCVCVCVHILLKNRVTTKMDYHLLIERYRSVKGSLIAGFLLSLRTGKT